MKILLVTRSYDQEIGGMETHTRAVVTYLTNSGFDVTVLTMEPRNGVAPIFSIPSVKVVRVSPPANKLLKYSLSYWLGVRRYVQRYGSNFNRIITVSMSAALLKKVPRNIKVINIQHGTYYLEQESLWLAWKKDWKKIKALLGVVYCELMKVLQRRVIAMSNVVIAVSTVARDSIVKNFKTHHGRIRLMRNFVDVTFFSYHHRTFRKGQLRLLFTGRLHQGKGTEVLKDAISLLADRDIFLPLTIVGDGPEFHMLQEYFLKKKYQHVQFTGSIDHQSIVQYYADNDILIFPSVSLGEAAPLSVLEAMSTGMVVIVSALPSLMELVKDGHNGYLFEMGDAQDLVNRLMSCLDNSLLLEGVAREARKTIEDRHNMDLNLSLLQEELS